MNSKQTQIGAGSPSPSTPLLACPWCGRVPRLCKRIADVATITHTRRCWFAGASKTLVGKLCFADWNRRHANAAVSGAAEPRTLDGLVGDLRRQVEVMRRIAADTESSLNEGDPVRRAFYDGRCCCLREQAMNIEDIIANSVLCVSATDAKEARP